MSAQQRCDICTETIREESVHYRLDRYDQSGYYDTLDICSAECLASAAVGDGHQRGAAEEFDAWRRKQPPPKRHWWTRRTA